MQLEILKSPKMRPCFSRSNRLRCQAPVLFFRRLLHCDLVSECVDTSRCSQQEVAITDEESIWEQQQQQQQQQSIGMNTNGNVGNQHQWSQHPQANAQHQHHHHQQHQHQQQWSAPHNQQPWNNAQASPRSAGYRGEMRVGYQGRVQGRAWNQNWQPQKSRQPPLDDTRQWLDSEEVLPGEKFRVLSYNILSADNAREHYRELYYHIPMRFVKWDWRKVRLTQEIEHWSPDIVCLQEVDRFEDLQQDLQKKGYTGVHKARTGAATDGCAIFWKEKRFLLVQEESAEFKDFGLRDNVAQFCVLKSTPSRTSTEALFSSDVRSTSNCVVVGNTHVLFNPKRGDIKLGQVRNLLSMAQELSAAWSGAQIIICGDFNSTPSSPLYNFISGAELDVLLFPKSELSGQKLDGEGRGPWRPYRRFQPALQTPRTPQTPQSSRSDTEATVFTGFPRELRSAEDSRCTKQQAEQPRHVKRNSLTMIEIVDSETDADHFSTVLLEHQSSTDMVSVIDEAEEPIIEEQVTKTGDIGPDSGLSEETAEEFKAVFVESETSLQVVEEEAGEMVHKANEILNSRGDAVPSRLGWTWEELQNATGSTQCTKIVHGLKLKSAYSGIKGKDGSRSSDGEPLVTTYHKKFMGTVDYIWHTEGLKTTRVLDVLPVDVLRRTGGLPSQKWGSDHLALVCDLVFVDGKHV